MSEKIDSFAVRSGLFPGTKITLVKVIDATFENTEPLEQITGVLRENVAIRGRIFFKHHDQPFGKVKLIFHAKNHLYIGINEYTYRVEN